VLALVELRQETIRVHASLDGAMLERQALVGAAGADTDLTQGLLPQETNRTISASPVCIFRKTFGGTLGPARPPELAGRQSISAEEDVDSVFPLSQPIPASHRHCLAQLHGNTLLPVTPCLPSWPLS
jgi:hypothetical protein